MSLRDDLASVIARDSRYSIHAYIFVFEAIEYTKKLRFAEPSERSRRVKAKKVRHVTGKELCEGAAHLALSQYGLLAMGVLAQWGLRTTSDLGNVVYNLIASGDLERTPTDSRSDFDGVYDFHEVFKKNFVFTMDDVA